MSFVMPERQPEDGSVSIERFNENELRISVSDFEERHTTTLRVSPFNAARIFGMLALFLGITLPTRLAKNIKL